MLAEAGMVTIHATTIRLPTPHLTAERRLVAPTPIMAPDIVCVVLTGMPRAAVANKTDAAPVSALNPWDGSSLVILVAMVFTILHPPKKVPNEIAV